MDRVFSTVVFVARATTAGRRVSDVVSGWRQHWLPVLLFTVMVGTQTVARTGDFAGYLDSTKPARNRLSQIFAIDGYVHFWDDIPVHGDARSFLALTRFLQGQQAPKDTGIYDRRAGYAYLGSLISLLLGHYQSFVVLNSLAWLGAVLTMYWLGRRLLNSRLAAWTAGTLTATGQGFNFMVGTPVSTLLGVASVAMILALVEWVDLVRPPFRWRDWLHAGWLIAAVSLFYPVNLVLLTFVWLYGLRRAPFIRLLGLSAITLVVTQAWPSIGTSIVGLGFDTANSALLAEALYLWWSALLQGPDGLFEAIRLVASAGTIYAAFPGLMLLAAAYGYIVAGERIRHWTCSVYLATLIPSLLFTIIFEIPRTAFLAYPAIYLLAAAGLAQVAQATANKHSRGVLSAVPIPLILVLLAAPSIVALVGYGEFDNNFHYWTPRWMFADER